MHTANLEPGRQLGNFGADRCVDNDVELVLLRVFARCPRPSGDVSLGHGRMTEFSVSWDRAPTFYQA